MNLTSRMTPEIYEDFANRVKSMGFKNPQWLGHYTTPAFGPGEYYNLYGKGGEVVEILVINRNSENEEILESHQVLKLNWESLTSSPFPIALGKPNAIARPSSAGRQPIGQF